MAEVHLQAFESFFLTSLGRGFAIEFYRSLLRTPTGIGVGALDDDGILIGFAAGSAVADGVYGAILRNGMLSLICSALPALLRHPSKIRRIITTFQRGSKIKGTGYASLLSFAVSPTHQGVAVGARLIKSFEDLAMQRGAKGVILTTDTERNDRVNQFYIRNGYRLRHTYVTKYGRTMNRYEKPLQSE